MDGIIEVDVIDDAAEDHLASIASSLRYIASLLAVAHGSCPDCGHRWDKHAARPNEHGCMATVPSRTCDYGTYCPCTEPRPA